MIASLLTAAWLGGSQLPSGGFLYPDRVYQASQARYDRTDPLWASVSGYAYSPAPLEHPDYSGDAPVGATPAALVSQLYYASSAGENLSILSTISEASVETSLMTRSAAAADRPVTVSTAAHPSPLARRYMSEYSIIHDAKAAVAVEDLITNLRGTEFKVSDRYLRQLVGHEPVDSAEAVLGESPDGDRKSRARRRHAHAHHPNGHRLLTRQNAVGLPKITEVLPTSDRVGLERPGDAWRRAEAEAARREGIVRAHTSSWMVAGTSLVAGGLVLGAGYLIVHQMGLF
ncbi:hypothetical protein [Thiolapillus sp.]|uniref:hypothetical protein n=1 Tax=Thiolapillus sp. TaxID=2017437 RepID=UPI003AF4A274